MATATRRIQRHLREGFEPLTVSVQTAQNILDVGNTKFWTLVKEGQIELANVGRRRMVIYASLKALTQPVGS